MSTPNAVAQQDKESDEALEALQAGAHEDPTDFGQEPAPEEKKDTPAEQPTAASDANAELERIRKELEAERHRNDSLQGRLDSQLRPMNDLVRELRGQIADLQTKVTKVATEPPKPAPTRHLRPEEVEGAGKEAIDLQSRVAQGVAEDAVAPIISDVASKHAEVMQRLAQLEAEKAGRQAGDLWDSVEKLVPGAKKLNAGDAGWFRFLDTVDPIVGRSRRELGEAAMSVGDVRRLGMLVQEYQEASGTGKPAPAAGVKPEVVRTEPAAPAAASGSRERKTTIRESDIKKFYTDWANGRYSGREAEAKRIDRAIDAALSEGRITPG